MSDFSFFTEVLRRLPAVVPFVGPDALQRRTGVPIRLRLGANESAFGISPGARAALLEDLDRCALYGDPESRDLRRALAERHGVAPENVVVASGIDELLGLAVRACVEPGAPVVTTRGSYPTFVYHARGFGGAVHEVAYRDDAVDLDGLAAAAREHGARIVYLANPDNPSGTLQAADAVLALIRELPRGTLLLLDEAYSDFVPEGRLPAVDARGTSVVRCRTFSKAHGLAGLRVGYAIADSEVVSALDRIRLHFGVNRFAQVAARASLEDADFVASVVAEVAEGREEYAALAAELGLRALPSWTNFVSIDVGTGERARALHAALLEDGVFVRRGEPPLDATLRVTVGRPEERAAFAEALRRHLAAVEGRAGPTGAEYFRAEWRGSPLVIRDMRPSDVEILVDYWHAATPEYIRSIGALPEKLGTREQTRAMFSTALKRDAAVPERAVFVADLGGLPVGYTLLNFEAPREACGHAHLIDEGVRGKGLGAVLFPAMLGAFLAAGLERLTFQTSPENRRINALLRWFGLRPREVDIAAPDGMARPGRFLVYTLDRNGLEALSLRARGPLARAPGTGRERGSAAVPAPTPRTPNRR